MWVFPARPQIVGICAIIGASLPLLIASCDTRVRPAASAPAAPDELRDPPVWSSRNGLLDVLVVAKAAAIPQFAPFNATGWVYEVCPRPADGATSCPVTDPASEYGGTRLQLDPGDVLKIHLVNKLPVFADAAYAREPMHDYLRLNPTNVHLHGMLVSPRAATDDDPTWGDNVFVYDFNSANGMPAADSMLHGVALYDAVDYKITVPLAHPAGVYWFHPHVHGISENQIAAGLGGIITVGRVADYMCAGASCSKSSIAAVPARHLILKDSQVLKDGAVLSQPRADFCDQPNSAAGQGSCEGVDLSARGGPDCTGGRWFFTLNGQRYPTLTIDSPAGQLWRIVNASADATYELNLWNPDTQKEIPLQVVSIDGVSIDVDAAANSAAIINAAGGRFMPVSCPGSGDAGRGVCTTRLHMMPSSRAEVWVTYRDAGGAIVAPSDGAHAVLRSSGYRPAPGPFQWPAVDLAQVSFAPGLAAPLDGISVAGQATSVARPEALATNLHAANAAVSADASCRALPPGHRRRVFFNTVPGSANPFGLGYEEIDADGAPLPGTFVDVHPFDPATPTICLPLGAGNSPVAEQWELLNLTTEDHKFHLHQAHFSLLSAPQVGSTSLPAPFNGSVMMDSVPLPHAEPRCPTVQDWRDGRCQVYPVSVQIPFAIAGDFVYHCHILAHEDGGMMALIRVRPAAASIAATTVHRPPSAGLVKQGLTGGANRPGCGALNASIGACGSAETHGWH